MTWCVITRLVLQSCKRHNSIKVNYFLCLCVVCSFIDFGLVWDFLWTTGNNKGLCIGLDFLKYGHKTMFKETQSNLLESERSGGELRCSIQQKQNRYSCEDDSRCKNRIAWLCPS